jgi:hypothetical protein
VSHVVRAKIQTSLILRLFPSTGEHSSQLPTATKQRSRNYSRRSHKTDPKTVQRHQTMSSHTAALEAFIEAAPPGEVFSFQLNKRRQEKLMSVIRRLQTYQTVCLVFLSGHSSYRQRADLDAHAAVKIITGDDSLAGLDGAFKKYNEEQLTRVNLPGGSQPVNLTENRKNASANILPSGSD